MLSTTRNMCSYLLMELINTLLSIEWSWDVSSSCAWAACPFLWCFALSCDRIFAIRWCRTFLSDDREPRRKNIPTTALHVSSYLARRRRNVTAARVVFPEPIPPLIRNCQHLSGNCHCVNSDESQKVWKSCSCMEGGRRMPANSDTAFLGSALSISLNRVWRAVSCGKLEVSCLNERHVCGRSSLANPVVRYLIVTWIGSWRVMSKQDSAPASRNCLETTCNPEPYEKSGL